MITDKIVSGSGNSVVWLIYIALLLHSTVGAAIRAHHVLLWKVVTYVLRHATTQQFQCLKSLSSSKIHEGAFLNTYTAFVNKY